MEDTRFQFISSSHYCVFGHRGFSSAAVNIYETEHALLMLIELAGTDPNTVHVEINANAVRIKGIRNIGPHTDLVRIHRMEIAAGPFQIEIPFNMSIDAERASSRYRHGLLEVVLPLPKEQLQRITVNVKEGEVHDR